VFADKKPGKSAERPEPVACHAFLDEGGTLVVPPLDRYGRSRLFHVFAVLAESVRELIDAGTCEGRAAAKA
jgi:DNA invertase Pin-like site-specific DNA recombinase